MARAETSGTAVALEREAVAQGDRLRTPIEPHQHWHVDVSYINLSGTFYYLCSVLDGCSRFLLH
jgi:putative transposase